MSVKNLFSNSKKYISRKFMRENYKSDPTFQKIATDPRMAKIIGRPNEQRNLHRRLMEEARDGKIHLDDMKKIARDLTSGKVGDISSTKGRSIAKEFFPNGLREEKDAKPGLIKSPHNYLNSKKSRSGSQNSPAGKSTPASPAYFTPRARSYGISPETSKDENKKSSFSDAMRSVSRNKRSQ